MVLVAERTSGNRGAALCGVGRVVDSSSGATVFDLWRIFNRRNGLDRNPNTNRLLMVSPWILLPVGVAIETAKPRWATFGLAAALLAIGAAGWYGIYSRRYYSAPRFIEPWQEVAGIRPLRFAMAQR